MTFSLQSGLLINAETGAGVKDSNCWLRFELVSAKP